MPRPNKNAIEFRSSDREMAKKMLREYFQQKGGLEYMKNAQQPSMFQDTETGEYIARPQRFKNGGMYAKKNKKSMYGKGGMANMLTEYMKGGMMKYPGGGMMPRKYEEGGTEPEKVSAEELARRLAAIKGRRVTLDGVTRAMGDEDTGYTTAVESTARPVIGIPVGLEEPSAAPGRMEEVPIRGPRAIKSSRDRSLVGGPREAKTEESSDDAIYFTPNTSNVRAYTRKDQTNPDAGYRTIGGEQDRFIQGFRSNGKTMYASPEVFELMRKEGVSPRDPYAIEFMKELSAKSPELFTEDNKYRGAINSMVMQEVYKDPTERGFLLPADQPVIRASF